MCKGGSEEYAGSSTVHSLWYDFAASMWSRLSHVRRSARDSPRDASGNVCSVCGLGLVLGLGSGSGSGLGLV